VGQWSTRRSLLRTEAQRQSRAAKHARAALRGLQRFLGACRTLAALAAVFAALAGLTFSGAGLVTCG
jgi:hypothetical protein